MSCNVEMINLPVIGNDLCPSNNTALLLMNVPSLIDPITNPNGYGLITWSQLASCISKNISQPPIIGISGSGGNNDPISGTSTYTNNSLQGIGNSNSDRFIININGNIWQNFGVNGNKFTFNAITNTLTFDPSIFVWNDGDSIYIDPNQ